VIFGRGLHPECNSLVRSVYTASRKRKLPVFLDSIPWTGGIRKDLLVEPGIRIVRAGLFETGVGVVKIGQSYQYRIGCKHTFFCLSRCRREMEIGAFG
jgi:hypothetical protein